MTPDQLVALFRQTLEAAFWVAAPVLIAATFVSLVINVGQVMTSIQDITVMTVPRLAAVGTIIFLLTPWILQHLVGFMNSLFGDFRAFTH